MRKQLRTLLNLFLPPFISLAILFVLYVLALYSIGWFMVAVVIVSGVVAHVLEAAIEERVQR